jgi:Flp pilus assembly protein TadD
LSEARPTTNWGGNEKALADYRTAIAISPNNAKYYFQRGKFWFDRKSMENADRDIKKALQLKPGYPDAMFFVIQNKLLKEKEFAKAIDACELVIKHHPDEKRAYYFRGTIRFKLKHFVNAEYDFCTAIQLDREYASAYRYRGVSKLNQNNVAGAMDDLNTAVILRPDYHQAYHDRALIWFHSQEFEEAKKQVDLAIKFGKSKETKDDEQDGEKGQIPIDYLLTRGLISDELGDSGSASEDFAEVLRRRPSEREKIPDWYRGFGH